MARKKEVEKVNGLPVRRKYKYAEDNLYGFAPYERRVVITCFHPKKNKNNKNETRVIKYQRWFARIETARRRLMDLSMDNGLVGEVFEVAHIRGLVFCTLTIQTDGDFNLWINRDYFKLFR